jgi:hypothetical protein
MQDSTRTMGPTEQPEPGPGMMRKASLAPPIAGACAGPPGLAKLPFRPGRPNHGLRMAAAAAGRAPGLAPPGSGGACQRRTEVGRRRSTQAPKDATVGLRMPRTGWGGCGFGRQIR